jgi:hypothetical protein
VGINTTAMIEAAILRRPVFTVRDPAFDHSQKQTLHFAYLQGGCVTTAYTLPEHVAQLETFLAGGGPTLEAADRFVEQFVRPLGITKPATAHLCDAIERVASARAAVRRPFFRLKPEATPEKPEATPEKPEATPEKPDATPNVWLPPSGGRGMGS